MSETAPHTTQDLESNLRQFTGTENWFVHPINRRMTYTDGVKYFAEVAGAYWFLDIVATEIFALQKDNPFISLSMLVKDNKASIVATDGDTPVPIWQRDIEFTDCPAGEWKFYFITNILLLPSEY